MLFRSIIAVLAALVTSYEAWKLIRYDAGEMAADVWRPFLNGAIMGLAVAATGRFLLSGSGYIVSLIVKVAVGVAVYFVLSVLGKQEELNEILNMLKGVLKRTNKTNE